MKQNIIAQKNNQKENLDNKENIDENKKIKTEKTELPLSLPQKEKKEEKENQKDISFDKESCKRGKLFHIKK